MFAALFFSAAICGQVMELRPVRLVAKSGDCCVAPMADDRAAPHWGLIDRAELDGAQGKAWIDLCNRGGASESVDFRFAVFDRYGVELDAFTLYWLIDRVYAGDKHKLDAAFAPRSWGAALALSSTSAPRDFDAPAWLAVRVGHNDPLGPDEIEVIPERAPAAPAAKPAPVAPPPAKIEKAEKPARPQFPEIDMRVAIFDGRPVARVAADGSGQFTQAGELADFAIHGEKVAVTFQGRSERYKPYVAYEVFNAYGMELGSGTFRWNFTLDPGKTHGATGTCQLCDYAACFRAARFPAPSDVNAPAYIAYRALANP